MYCISYYTKQNVLHIKFQFNRPDCFPTLDPVPWWPIKRVPMVLPSCSNAIPLLSILLCFFWRLQFQAKGALGTCHYSHERVVIMGHSFSLVSLSTHLIMIDNRRPPTSWLTWISACPSLYCVIHFYTI